MSDKGRFWDKKSESSGSESESEAEQPSGGQAQPQNATWFDSDSDSDNEARVARSARDRKHERLLHICKNIANHLRISDWKSVQDDYDELQRTVAKAAALIRREGYPRSYFKGLLDIQKAVAATSKDDKKRFSPTNTRAFNRVSRNITKILRDFPDKVAAYEQNPLSDQDVLDMLGHGGGGGGDADDDSDDEINVNPRQSQQAGRKRNDSSDGSDSSDDSDSDSDSDDSDSESSDSEWDSSSSDSSSSSDDGPQPGQPRGRDFWLKRKTDTKKDKRKRRPAQAPTTSGPAAPVKEDVKAKEEEFTVRVLRERLRTIVSQMGKKGISKDEQIAALKQLADKSLAFAPRHSIPVRMHLITARFDASSRLDSAMPVEHWKQVASELSFVLDVLQNNPELRLAAVTAEEVGGAASLLAKSIAAEQLLATGDQAAPGQVMTAVGGVETAFGGGIGAVVSTASVAAQVAGNFGVAAAANAEADEDDTSDVVRVVGNLAVFLQRLSEEYIKDLQNSDPHSHGFVDRVQDERFLHWLCMDALAYFKRCDEMKSAAQVALLCVEHLYYRHRDIAGVLDRQWAIERAQLDAELVAKKVVLAQRRDAVQVARREAVAQKKELPPLPNLSLESIKVEVDPSTVAPVGDRPDPEEFLQELINIVYQDGDNKQKDRATLCLVYNSALNNRFFKARDLMLMSHIQESIETYDISTQIVFNRAMVQLGLCAFRQGLMRPAHDCLSRFMGSGKSKELLAQGVSNARNQRRNVDLEKEQRRRQVPYHMHINLDLLDACYLIAAVLLERPNMAAAETDSSRRVISFHFRKQLDNYSSGRSFVGPPENTRDHIMSAQAALEGADWKEASELLCKLPVWDLWAVYDTQSVKDMIVKATKEASLLVFLHSYATCYDSLSHDRLCEMFELSSAEVHCVASRLMNQKELSAAWDQPTNTIVMHKADPSRLQTIALELADKANIFVDANERSLSARLGTDRHERDDKRPTGSRKTGGGRYRRSFNPRSTNRRFAGHSGNKRSGTSRSGRKYGGRSNRQYGSRSGGGGGDYRGFQ